MVGSWLLLNLAVRISTLAISGKCESFKMCFGIMLPSGLDKIDWNHHYEYDSAPSLVFII